MNYFEAERNRVEPPSNSSMIPVTRYPQSFSMIDQSKDNTTTVLKTPYGGKGDAYGDSEIGEGMNSTLKK